MEHTPEPPKSFLQKLQERAAASRFFTVSVLIHMALIIIGGGVVLFKHIAEPPDFNAGGGSLVGDAAPAQAPPEQAPDVQQQLTPQAPSLNAPDLSAITSTAASPNFTVAATAPVSISVPADAMQKVLTASGPKGLAGLPGAMAGRAGGTARGNAMKKNGGKPESELAVLRGLRWLVKTQKSDGSWSEQHKAGMTGLALLSFLGHGETPVSPEFGPTISRAIDWVLENGKKNNGHLSMAGGFGNPGCYEHGILTYALGEYYTMTKDDRAAELFKQTIKYIVDGQGADGGWAYGMDQKGNGDTSVSGWQIQALKAAYISGLGIEGVDTALDKAMLNLERVQGPAGGFGYTSKADTYGLTGVGVLCTYFWKKEVTKSVAMGINFIFSQLAANPVEYKHPTANLYAWYYNTQACLMVGGKAWTTWNGMFQDVMIKSQAADGSWPPMAVGSHGNLQIDEAGAGPYYRTCLSILMLEVYYRYSPTMGGSSLEAKPGTSLDKPKPS